MVMISSHQLHVPTSMCIINFTSIIAESINLYYDTPNVQLMSYRQWTGEFDEVIGELQVHMEQECDVYFEKIKHKVIEVCIWHCVLSFLRIVIDSFDTSVLLSTIS